MNDETLHPDNLLNNDSFISWILYNKDAVVWNEVLTKNPEQREAIEKARQLTLDLYYAENVLYSDINVDSDQLWSRIDSSIQAELSEDVEPQPHIQTTKKTNWIYATLYSFIIFTVAFDSIFIGKQISYNDLVREAQVIDIVLEKVNNSIHPLRLTLPDGSTVTLGKNSRLTYPEHFKNNKREVILTGKATFDIKKNSVNPFYVFANETVTKVLGTSFEINAFENSEEITIKVLTGRVSVYKHTKTSTTDPESTGLVLQANQVVTFDRKNEILNKNLVALPLPIIPIQGPVNIPFNEVVASDIFQELERIYGVQIIYDCDLLSKCIVSTTIKNQSLYDNLEVLCKTINSRFKEVDAQIIIESQGCL